MSPSACRPPPCSPSTIIATAPPTRSLVDGPSPSCSASVGRSSSTRSNSSPPWPSPPAPCAARALRCGGLAVATIPAAVAVRRLATTPVGRALNRHLGATAGFQMLLALLTAAVLGGCRETHRPRLRRLRRPSRSAGDLVRVEPKAVDFVVSDREGRAVPLPGRGAPEAARLDARPFLGDVVRLVPDRVPGDRRAPARSRRAWDPGRGGVDRPARLAGDRSTGRESRDRPCRPLHDVDRRAAQAAGIVGLPTTLVVDGEGREVARIIGAGRGRIRR